MALADFRSSSVEEQVGYYSRYESRTFTNKVFLSATFFSHVQFKKMLAEQLPDVMDMVNANAKIFKRGSKTRLSAEFCTSQNMEAISEVATETSDVNEVLVMTAMRVMESLSKRKEFTICLVRGLNSNSGKF